VSKDLVEVGQKLLTTELHLERVLIGFLDLATKFAFEGSHQQFGARGERQSHVDLVSPFVIECRVLETNLMAKLKVIDIQLIGQLDGSID
jgi:hypothetical protein